MSDTCAMCNCIGTTFNHIEQHHLVSRKYKAVKDQPINLFPLCHTCHHIDPKAPHVNQDAFDDWLRAEWPQRYKWMMSKRRYRQ